VEKQPIEVDRRIAVWGVTGSGKTTLAQRLAAILGVGVVELDAIRHARGWDSTDWPEFRTVLTERLDSMPDGWVVEGSYSAIMGVYLSRIDTMVWIHLPFRTSFWRLLKRTIPRGVKQTQLYTPTGPHESIRQTFFSRQSILWWSITSHRGSSEKRRERIAALPPHVRVYELRSPQEVEAFVQAVQSQVGRTAAAQEMV
jgi:adenylate kinase family enzyme